MQQDQIVEQNRIAWESQSYEAWVCAYGTPESAAAKLISEPARKLKKILPYLNNPKNKKIANPLGSHGRVATALALLGADVTVFDLAEPNQRYALELAESAGVRIQYELGDFLHTAQAHNHQFDQVVMELGVVHYFSDLNCFANTVAQLLKPNAMVVLHEFHPLMKKAINIVDGGIQLSGDYFSYDLESAQTPYSTFLNNQAVPECLIRRWNLGEIVTAFATAGFRLNTLVEQPCAGLAQLPGTFIYVASLE